MIDTSIASMTDLVPSISDTILRNGALYDVHMFREGADSGPARNRVLLAP